MEGRLKNVLEGMLLGGLTESIFMELKHLKNEKNSRFS